MKQLVTRITDFIDHEIWREDGRRFGRFTRAALHVTKIVVMTVREFMEQKATVRASALTYYTLLSFIPILALIFAIAKGFGLESLLTTYLQENITSTEIVKYLMGFISNALNNAKGGIIAGVGVIMLLYSVFKLLNNVEAAFNFLWCVRNSRSLLRKVTDYVCIMIFSPILLITALSANIVVRSSLNVYVSGAIQDFILGFGPYVMLWLVFTLFYLVMPNAKVKLAPALISGVITGTAFQVVQWVYITFQVGVNNAGAIYGSFAFFPLLLAWLQLTWTIVLAGCKIAFSIQNVTKYTLEHGACRASANLQRTYSLLIMYHAVKDFEAQKRTTGVQMANEIEIPQILFFFLAERLKEAHLLAELKTKDEKEDRTFIPALDPAVITPRLIIQRLDSLGDDDKMHIARTPVFESLRINVNSDTPISKILL